MKKKTNDRSGVMKLFVFGASLAGLAAAYFFLSPKSKKNLENTKSWVIKMKGDVVEKLEQAREMSETIYNEIIDSVAAKYEKNLKSSPEEIRELAQDLKTHWQAISRSVKAKKVDDLKEISKPVKERKIIKKL
jgi:gas vesicle protein